MNKLIVALATLTGALAVENYYIRRNNRELRTRIDTFNNVTRGEIALRWFQTGGAVALADSRAVKEAHDKLFPPTPPFTDN